MHPRHFEMDFVLVHSAPVSNRLTSEAVLLQPAKGVTWVNDTCLAQGALMVTRSAEVYPFSKKVAREIRQSQSMPSAIQRSAASELQRLQRGQTTTAAIIQNVLEKVEEGKCLAVVDLISGVGDWGAGVLSEAQRLGLTQQSQEKEQNVRLKYLGFDFREYA
ncbi:unnamed protein product, partial [Effrenium voratum]